MFDQSTKNTNSFNFNSVSGTLVKSHQDSYFVRCHMNSTVAEGIFHHKIPNISGARVQVLQVMLCADSQFLIELNNQQGN